MHSALGRGSHHSVIAGTVHRPQRSYFPLAFDYLKLHNQQRKLEQMFMTRDVIFNNRFPEAARVNGVFRLTPHQRREYHYNEIMPAIRRRTILMKRIQKQRNINNSQVSLVAAAETSSKNKNNINDDPRASLVTPDSDVYFKPTSKIEKSPIGSHKYNNWPNFWQHPSRSAALVPKPHWERHPELGGITRVHNPVSPYSAHY